MATNPKTRSRKSPAQLDLEIKKELAQGKQTPATSSRSKPGESSPVILMREGKGWRQYIVVTDGRTAVVEMTPALLGGWKFHRVTVQGDADWNGMSRDQILAWKRESDDGRTSIVKDLSVESRDRLLDHAKLK